MRLDELIPQQQVEQQLLQFKLSDLHDQKLDELREEYEKLKIEGNAHWQYREKMYKDLKNG